MQKFFVLLFILCASIAFSQDKIVQADTNENGNLLLTYEPPDLPEEIEILFDEREKKRSELDSMISLLDFLDKEYSETKNNILNLKKEKPLFKKGKQRKQNKLAEETRLLNTIEGMLLGDLGKKVNRLINFENKDRDLCFRQNDLFIKYNILLEKVLVSYNSGL